MTAPKWRATNLLRKINVLKRNDVEDTTADRRCGSCSAKSSTNVEEERNASSEAADFAFAPTRGKRQKNHADVIKRGKGWSIMRTFADHVAPPLRSRITRVRGLASDRAALP